MRWGQSHYWDQEKGEIEIRSRGTTGFRGRVRVRFITVASVLR